MRIDIPPLDTDATEYLTDKLNSAPNGSTIVLEPGTYVCNGTPWVSEKEGLRIRAEGATIVATENEPRRPAGVSDENFARMVRGRQHFRLSGCTDIRLYDITVKGSNPSPGPEGEWRYEYEAQHGINIQGCHDVRLVNPHISSVWGDFVEATEMQGEHTTGVRIINPTFSGSGRQGLGITGCKRAAPGLPGLRVVGGYIGNVKRSVIDMEPYNEAYEIGGIAFVGVTFGPYGLNWIACGGAAANVGDVRVAECKLPDALPRTMVIGKADARRHDFYFARNWCGRSSNDTKFSFDYVDGIVFRNNVFPIDITKGPAMPRYDLKDCTGVIDEGNDWGEGIEP